MAKKYSVWIATEEEIDIVAPLIHWSPEALRTRYQERLAKDELCVINVVLNEDEVKTLLEKKPKIPQSVWNEMLSKNTKP